MFQSKKKNRLSITASDSSVLEKFHCKMFLSILSQKDSNIFENLGIFILLIYL